jgi:hypothetical protein
MITEITRSHIRVQVGDKALTIEGEGFARGYGSPDFVIYRNSIQRWDPPFDDMLIDEQTKDKMLCELKEEMSVKGMTIEIE